MELNAVRQNSPFYEDWITFNLELNWRYFHATTCVFTDHDAFCNRIRLVSALFKIYLIALPYRIYNHAKI